MRGAVFLLLCAVALTKGASIEVKVDNEDSDGNNTVINNDPSQAPAICADEESDGVLVANEICNRYYMCARGLPISMKCPENLWYNYNTEQCDWPENVECGDRVVSYEDDEDDTNEDEQEIEDSNFEGNGTNSDHNEAPTICAAEESDGILVAHEYCNYFYICSGSKPVSMKCPPNLLYSYKKEQCDWSEKVDCGDRPINEEEEDEEEDKEDDNNDDYEEVENEGSNSDPNEAPTICAAEESDGVLVAHEYCNYFYICSGLKAVSMKCPLNLVYCYKKEKCDWPENVDCGDRVIYEEEEKEEDESDDEGEEVESDGGNSDPSEAAAICAAAESDGILVANKYCNKFYNCLNGNPVVQECPDDLLFNPARHYCDWPQNVDCGDRLREESIDE